MSQASREVIFSKNITGFECDAAYPDMAECGVLREVNGNVYSFPVVFIRNEIGTWKVWRY
jgi:hypothetical protein